jgi:hypothetical protein
MATAQRIRDLITEITPGTVRPRVPRVAAFFYSLIESVKLGGVERRAYLSEAARSAIRNPGTATLPRDSKSPESRGKPVLDRSGAKTPEWPRTYIRFISETRCLLPEGSDFDA